jgi:hypothetical protein
LVTALPHLMEQGGISGSLLPAGMELPGKAARGGKSRQGTGIRQQVSGFVRTT